MALNRFIGQLEFSPYVCTNDTERAQNQSLPVEALGRDPTGTSALPPPYVLQSKEYDLNYFFEQCFITLRKFLKVLIISDTLKDKFTSYKKIGE